MKIADMAASGSWTLGLKNGSADQADFPAYALRFRNQQGDDNPEPIAYPVKVIRDEPPTIDILRRVRPRSPSRGISRSNSKSVPKIRTLPWSKLS